MNVDRYKYATIFTIASIAHIVRPEPFLKIMPDVIPFKREVNLIVAGIEGIFGLLLFLKKPSKLFKTVLILFLLAVYPGNIKMALDRIHFGNEKLMPAIYARLPLQFKMMNDVRKM